MRRYLIDDRHIDGLLDFMCAMGGLSILYHFVARWFFPDLPVIIALLALLVVGLFSCTLHGAKGYMRGALQRIFAWIFCALTAAALFGSAAMAAAEFGSPAAIVESPLYLLDVAVAVMLLGWGFHLFLSAAMRKRREPPETLSPRFMAHVR